MNAIGHVWEEGFGAVYEGIVIVGGRRTPFGAFCKSLARINPTDLGILAGREVLKDSGVDPACVDQVAFASVAQSGADAYYLPRHIGLYCGVPKERPAVLLQRICGSGFETVIHAAEQIALGKARIALAGGTESMSLNPTAAYGLRLGHDLGKPGFVDTLWATLNDPACGCTMGETAENLAKLHGITREEVDRFAASSQEKYFLARERGFFDGELFPVRPGALEGPAPLQPRKVAMHGGAEELAQDEHPRRATAEKLAKLPPVFGKGGVQTAGNSSGIVDGACALVVASEEAARKQGLKPLGRLLASVTVGVSPEVMGIGPAPAIRKLLAMTGTAAADVHSFEINEAFGAQCLAVIKDLQLDPAKVNANGGAIAIGHPLAASGARLTLTLLRHLSQSGGRMGVASACIGGGQGTALMVAPY